MHLKKKDTWEAYGGRSGGLFLGMVRIKIGRKWVGDDEPVFVIAEAGSNHDGKLAQAKKLIDIAAKAGADAVKFQTFAADKLVARTESYYDLLKGLEIPDDWHTKLARHARKRNIIFLSTPFHEEAVHLLNSVGVPAFKISSGDVTNVPLIECVARTGKPVLLATGTATIKEVGAAVRLIKSLDNDKIILLHCVSSYPASMSDLNLRVIGTLRRKFGLPVGFSDHSLGIIADVSAATLGACVIEKHFTLDRALKGPDHSYALDPQELAMMVSSIRVARAALGDGVKRVVKSELGGRKRGQRGIYAARDIPAGETITEDALITLRPPAGINAIHFRNVVGRKAKTAIPAGTPLNRKMIL